VKENGVMNGEMRSGGWRRECRVEQETWNNADPQAKSIPVRKDDEVLIVRGKYKGREGKVTQVRN
jgi:ribosomal protein uL24